MRIHHRVIRSAAAVFCRFRQCVSPRPSGPFRSVRKKLLLLVLLGAGPLSVGTAQEHPFGLGIMAGEPFGISMLARLSDEVSLNGAAGWSLHGDRTGGGNDGRRFHVHVDLLRYSFHVFRIGERYPMFAGIGLRMNSGAGLASTVTLRGVAGVAWMPRNAPLDFFMELVPMLQLIPPGGTGLEAGAGLRYLF